MGRNYFEKRRKLFSWVFAIGLATLVLITRSAWEDTGLVSDMLFFVGLALVGVATVGRLWCSLYICGYKTSTLITVGPYSICRNPLYFFSLLGGLGVGLSTETLTVAGLILAAFALYYPLVVVAEERKLLVRHGDEYRRYEEGTPRFWPSFARLCEPQEYKVKPRVFRRGLLDALIFVWLVAILELVEALHEHQVIATRIRLY